MPATLLPWQPLVRSVRCLVQVRTSRAAVRVYPFHVLCAAEHILGSGISRFISTRFASDRHSVAQVGQVPLGSLQVLPTLQFSWNWDGLTLFTSAPVDCSLSWTGCTRCLRVIGALSPCACLQLHVLGA